MESGFDGKEPTLILSGGAFRISQKPRLGYMAHLIKPQWNCVVGVFHFVFEGEWRSLNCTSNGDYEPFCWLFDLRSMSFNNNLNQ